LARVVVHCRHSSVTVTIDAIVIGCALGDNMRLDFRICVGAETGGEALRMRQAKVFTLPRREESIDIFRGSR
jgi:hypothetical protein